MAKTLATVTAALLSSFAAHAATVEYSYGVPPTLMVTEITQSGNLSLFDPAMGTLTDARLEVQGAANFVFQITNPANQVRTATVTSFIELDWSSSLGALTPFLLDTMTMSVNSGSQTYGAGETKLFGPSMPTEVLDDNLVGILASLQGPGSFSLTCESTSGLELVGGGGALLIAQITQAGCGARIIYTFTPTNTTVPEPTSLALAALALTATGFASRRRRA